MTDKRIKGVLDRLEKLKRDKQNWLETYQRVGEYVRTLKQDFNGVRPQGEILTTQVFDDTAPNAAHLTASSLIGALWPNGGDTFKIEASPRLPKSVKDSDAVKLYFEEVTRRLSDAFDAPEAGFITTLDEYMLDQVCFGTSGIAIEENTGESAYDAPLRFINLDVTSIYIDEGADGFVDTIYEEKEFTVRQLVQEYKLQNVSKKSQEAFAKDNFCMDKVKVVIAIEPNPKFNPKGITIQENGRISSLHVEDGKHILRDSAYKEMPGFVTRFWKASKEIYGRAPGTELLPSIFEINAQREMFMLANEKHLDPPIALYDESAVGGGTIDTSAGAAVIFKSSGKVQNGGKIWEPMVTVGELSSTAERINKLEQNIERGFFIDRLLDLNNTTRMTLGEANIRNELRGQSLGTIYARQIVEMFTRIIKRGFNIMYNKGLLGVLAGSQEALMLEAEGEEPLVIPAILAEQIKKERDVYKIKYISPAAKIMRSQELGGIVRTLEFVTTNAPVFPEMADNINQDETLRAIQDLSGAPLSMLNSKETVTRIRNQRAEAQQAAMQQAAAQQAAETARSAGSAAQSFSLAAQ